MLGVLFCWFVWCEFCGSFFVFVGCWVWDRVRVGCLLSSLVSFWVGLLGYVFFVLFVVVFCVFAPCRDGLCVWSSLLVFGF